MPIIDPDQGVPLPTGTDLADNPAAFSNFYTPVLSRQNNRYTDVANRTALHPANIDGEESYLTTPNQKEMNNGTAWISSYVPSLFAYQRMAADQTVNNSTALVNVTNMVITFPSTGIYGFRAAIFYDTSTTADIKFTFTWPAGATARWGVHGLAVGAAASTGDGQFAATDVSGTTIPLGGAGTGTGNTLVAMFEGEINMAGSAGGNLQMQFAQQALDPTNSVVRTRSRLLGWRSS